MKTFKLFDHEINVKDFSCSHDGQKPQKLKPYTNLYVKLSDSCQANCPFCVFHGVENSRKFDEYKLYYIITRLQRSGLKLAKINFTGGEPTLHVEKLIDVINKINEINDKIYITVNTNGYELDQLVYANLDIISLSRHHWDDTKNEEIFNTTKVPSRNYLKNVIFKEKIHLRCNLIKGYIDSRESIQAYMDEMAKDGFFDFGFVSLMDVNQFCRDKFVDYSKIEIDKIPRVRTTSMHSLEDFCSCKNYLYATPSGLVQLYSRRNDDISRCESTLVYDVDKLTDGFGGKIIL